MRCFTAAVILTALLLAGCDRKESSSAPAAPTAPAGNAPSIELTFTYGSEKEKWIKDVTDTFNASGAKTADGKVIRVTAIPKGSGESIDELLDGRVKAHLASPASAAFIELGNAQSRAKTGSQSGRALRKSGSLAGGDRDVEADG